VTPGKIGVSPVGRLGRRKALREKEKRVENQTGGNCTPVEGNINKSSSECSPKDQYESLIKEVRASNRGGVNVTSQSVPSRLHLGHDGACWRGIGE